MRRSIATATLGGLLVLATAAAALAGDTCLNLGGIQFVGKGVKIPGKGKCVAWKGFTSAGGLCSGTSGYTSGTLCTASDDSRTDGSLVTTCMTGFGPNVMFTDHFSLPRPALTGGTERFSTVDVGSSPGSSSLFPATVVDCLTIHGSKSPPIP